jgi:O-antigen ligase
MKRVRFPVEIGALIVFCVFLPLLEAPKNLAWLAYVLVWLANRVRTRTIGSWRVWDSLAIAWIGSAYLAAAFAGLGGNAWAKTGDVATHVLLFWLVMRAGYSDVERRWLLGALISSAVAGLLYGYWRLWTGASGSGTLQLNSVGHVNHTAIYVAIVLGICVSWLIAGWRSWGTGRRAAMLALAAFVLVSLVETASRGAIGIGLAMIALVAAAWWPHWRAPLIAAVAVSFVVVAAAIGFNADVIRKQEANAAAHNILAFRGGIWRMGLAGWERYPWFGVGKDNYKLISHDLVRTWRAEAGEPYDASQYVHFPHAHNLFVNTLVERGVIGFAGMAAILIAWLVALVRCRPRPQDGEIDWVSWGSAAGAWIVTVGVGTVNTTLHHEHGLLAALLLGLWLQKRSPQAGS